MAKTVVHPNYFIAALEWGSIRMEEGISFKEMVEYLKANDQITDAALANFRGWFFNIGFFVPEYENYLRSQHWDQIIRPDDIDGRFNQYKGFVKGESYFKYLEYIEVKEALKNSKNSSTIAITALVISTIVGIVQIIISISN